jgi:hypothetical protein
LSEQVRHPQDVRTVQTGLEAATESTCKEWSAWYKEHPPGGKTPACIGDVYVFATGYEVKLKPRLARDTSAEVYIFDLAIIPPKGVETVSFLIRHIPVSYVEEIEHRFYLIRIEPDHITVPV